jgi:hypothetical protein
MRVLGIESPFGEFRLDLVHLLAKLQAHPKTELRALAADVTPLLDRLRAQRDELERAEDLLTVSQAQVEARDEELDDAVAGFAGTAKRVHPELWSRFFPMSPSEVQRSALEREVATVDRQLAELRQLAAGDPLRAAWEAPLADAVAAVKQADAGRDEQQTAIALVRTRVQTLKADLDRARVALHGRALAILGEKGKADRLFRARPLAAKPAVRPPAGAPVA